MNATTGEAVPVDYQPSQPPPLVENPAKPPQSSSPQSASPGPETPQPANLPQTIRLPSGRQIKVNPLPWQGYKKIRSQILSILTGEIGNAARDFAQKFIEAADREPGKDFKAQIAGILLSSGLIGRIPALLVDIENRVEDLATDLVAACCEGLSVDILNGLPVYDVLTLRRRVLDSINLSELLDAEKNLFRGIFESVMKTVRVAGQDETVSPATDSNGTNQAPSVNDAGGQAGNP